ncbi:hypothetical protein GOBAR_DD18917 [Gossypium barbadense]|nr:hypothetical protein GOBAR_DD18917 [Gossypium barbadense]
MMISPIYSSYPCSTMIPAIVSVRNAQWNAKLGRVYGSLNSDEGPVLQPAGDKDLSGDGILLHCFLVNGKHPQERSALVDITNDYSPIVGLAMETPSSAIGKQRSSRAKSMMMTPGSGEALLRDQVKTLLQKVEEEAELSNVSMQSHPFLLHPFLMVTQQRSVCQLPPLQLLMPPHRRRL